MKTFIRVAFAVAMGGCGPQVGGNPALGIERFEVDETPLRTVVRGIGRGDEVVGRLELVHGRFRLSGVFAEGYDDPEVDGRKLEVSVLGQQLQWETEGFTPTLHMPAHPPDQWALAAFLDDARVAPILRRWQIGFGPIDSAPRLSQGLTMPNGYTCDITGTHPGDCSGLLRSTTIFGARFNMCGGSGLSAGDAWSVHQDAAHWGFNQTLVAQCCPDLLFGPCTSDADCATSTQTCVEGRCFQYAFFDVKSCPDPGASRVGTCGLTGATATCKGCALYPTQNHCSIDSTAAGWFDADAPFGGGDVYNLCYKFPGSAASETATWARTGVGVAPRDGAP